MKLYKAFALFTTFMLLVSAVGVLPAVAAGAAPADPSGDVRQLTAGADITPQTGSFTKWKPGTGFTEEFQGEGDAKAPTHKPMQFNRSLSQGNTGEGGAAASIPNGPADNKMKGGFEGLNFFQQRWARGGNQWSIEPPDQALCVGNGFIFEAVNDVVNVYNSKGESKLKKNDVSGAVDLNSFYGYAATIDRTTGVYGPSLTDPSCLYDAATNRFFVSVLTFEIDPATGDFTGQNHIDVAVSRSGDPTKKWIVYQMDVTMDGSNSKDNPTNVCPCLGDYPHIGADSSGFYVTTNSYPWSGNGFNGAQIYAYPKGLMAAGATSINVVHFNTWNAVNEKSDAGKKQPGFTVWPATSPANQFNTDKGGTEYFLSSNAADEATHPIAGTGGTYNSSELVVWTLTNTSSLNTLGPLSIKLTNKIAKVGKYGLPPKAKQAGGSGKLANTISPLGYCINDTTTLLFDNATVGCWNLTNDTEPAHDEKVATIDTNDTRIQQVMYSGGKLYSALDTSYVPGSGPTRAGIEWFVINPDPASVAKQGYLGAVGYDFYYPAIGVNGAGKGVIAFTASGDAAYPGAAFAGFDTNTGVSAWSYVKGGQGAAPDDGFTNYKSQVGDPPRVRWGDYGAAAVDGNSIWMASEYIANACDYTTWGGDNFAGGTGWGGVCGGTRGFYGNWSTRISQYQP